MTSTGKKFPKLAGLIVSTTLLITLVSSCNLNEFGEPIQVKATFTLRVSATATPTFIPPLTATTTLTPLPPTEAPTQAPTETAYMGQHDMNGKIKLANPQETYKYNLKTAMLHNSIYMAKLLILDKPILETGVGEEQLKIAIEYLRANNYQFPGQLPDGEQYNIYAGIGTNTLLKVRPAGHNVDFRNLKVEIYTKADFDKFHGKMDFSNLLAPNIGPGTGEAIQVGMLYTQNDRDGSIYPVLVVAHRNNTPGFGFPEGNEVLDAEKIAIIDDHLRFLEYILRSSVFIKGETTELTKKLPCFSTIMQKLDAGQDPSKYCASAYDIDPTTHLERGAGISVLNISYFDLDLQDKPPQIFSFNK